MHANKVCGLVVFQSLSLSLSLLLDFESIGSVGTVQISCTLPGLAGL